MTETLDRSARRPDPYPTDDRALAQRSGLPDIVGLMAAPEMALTNQVKWRIGICDRRLKEAAELVREAAASPDYRGPRLEVIERIAADIGGNGEVYFYPDWRPVAERRIDRRSGQRGSERLSRHPNRVGDSCPDCGSVWSRDAH
jgi:hypothetical protein